jgi:hypothetical protein
MLKARFPGFFYHLKKTGIKAGFFNLVVSIDV